MIHHRLIPGMETMGVLIIFHLVSAHAVTVEKANFLILLPPHVVHTLVGLHISDLGGGGATFQTTAKMAPLNIDMNLRRGLFTVQGLTKAFLIIKMGSKT